MTNQSTVARKTARPALVCMLLTIGFFCPIAIVVPRHGIAGEPRIAVVHSYHAEYSWVKEINKGIADYHRGRSSFGIMPDPSFGAHTLTFFHLDAKRHQGDEKYLSVAGQSIAARIHALLPSVTITSDDEALQYVAVPLKQDDRHRFVFLAVNHDPRLYGAVDNYEAPEFNITGLLSEHPFAHAVKLMSEVVRGNKHIDVFFDDSVSGRGIYQNFVRQLDRLPPNVRGRIRHTLISNSWRAWKSQILQHQQKDTFFVIGTFYSLNNGTGSLVSEQEVIAWMTAHSRVPELAVVSSNVTEGLFLTISNPGYVHGYMACHKVAQLLRGKKVAEVPIEVPQQKAMHVNMARAKQLGINVPIALIATADYYRKLGY